MAATGRGQARRALAGTAGGRSALVGRHRRMIVPPERPRDRVMRVYASEGERELALAVDLRPRSARLATDGLRPKPRRQRRRSASSNPPGAGRGSSSTSTGEPSTATSTTRGRSSALRDDVVDAAHRAGSMPSGDDGASSTATSAGRPPADTVGVSVGFEVVDRVKPADMRRRCSWAAVVRTEPSPRAHRGRPGAPRHVPPRVRTPSSPIDLLWVDDEPLVDVPAPRAEAPPRGRPARSRTSSGAVRTSGQPVGAWYGHGARSGFHEMAVRNANSRYRPGRAQRRLGHSR